MKLGKAIERITLQDTLVSDMFRRLDESVKSNDKYLFRELVRNIYMKCNGANGYKIIIVDIGSGTFTREIVAYPDNSNLRKFKFRY